MNDAAVAGSNPAGVIPLVTAMQPPCARDHVRLLRAFASRVGHDAVWLMIAGLFCVVEGAVKITELTPARFRRRRVDLQVPLSPAKLTTHS